MPCDSNGPLKTSRIYTSQARIKFWVMQMLVTAIVTVRFSQGIWASGNYNGRQSGGQSGRFMVYVLICDNCDTLTTATPNTTPCQCFFITTCWPAHCHMPTPCFFCHKCACPGNTLLSSALGPHSQTKQRLGLWHAYQSTTVTKACSQRIQSALLWTTWYCLGDGKALGNRYIILHVILTWNVTCFIMNIPPDPVVNPLALCIGRSGHPCGQLMGPLRVYQGKGDTSKKHMRGALVQTVCLFYLLRQASTKHLFLVYYIRKILILLIETWACLLWLNDTSKPH